MELNRGPRRERGMSVVEVLVASGLLLIVAVGILPLFTQAMVSNLSGDDSTRASNFARTRAEELLQLDFNSPDLTVNAGNERVLDDSYFSQRDQRWKPAPAPSTDPPAWFRTTRVRQYRTTALDDDRLSTAEALPAGDVPDFKEINVDIRSATVEGPLGRGRRVTIQAIKVK
jgi:hypothetical protein